MPFINKDKFPDILRMRRAKNEFRQKREDDAKTMQAKADLMEETRLATKAKEQHALATAAERDEAKLPKTAASLQTLGAGTPYGG